MCVCWGAVVSQLVTASADGTARIYNTMTGACQAILIGHEGEISKVRVWFLCLLPLPDVVLIGVWLQVTFNPSGSRILTASSDKTARVWDVESGECSQMLEGHTDEIFSCAFNYDGDTIITGAAF